MNTDATPHAPRLVPLDKGALQTPATQESPSQTPTPKTEPAPKPALGLSTIFLRGITTIDMAIFDPMRGILGDSWQVDAVVAGAADHNGFVYDFSKFKSRVKSTLKATVDHALLVPRESENISCQSTTLDRESWSFTWGDSKPNTCSTKELTKEYKAEPKTQKLTYECPTGAVFCLPGHQVTKDNVAAEVSSILMRELPHSVRSVQLQFRKENIADSQASYRYTHGITHHDGLCQRLFHGHRNIIEIFVNGGRRPDIEAWISEELFNKSIHIAGTNQIESGPYQVRVKSNSQTPLILSYQAKDGVFSATIPSNQVFVIEGETSVENLAGQLARTIREKSRFDSHIAIDPIPQGSFSSKISDSDSIEVHCFEGIGKGAIGRA